MTAIRLWRLCLWFLVFASTQVSADPRVVRLGFDDYCPYCCTQGSRKGFVIDALEKILKDQGLKIESIVGSWPRIKEMAKKGSIDLLLPVNQMEVLELGIQRTKRSIGWSEAAYFVHKDSKWSFQGKESLVGPIFGIIQGYAYPEPIKTHLKEDSPNFSKIVLTSEQGNQRQIKMLASHRIDVVPAERLVFSYMAKNLGLAASFKEAGTLPMSDDIAIFYVGISSQDKNLAHSLGQWLDEGLDQMNKTHQYQDLIREYLPDFAGKE